MGSATNAAIRNTHTCIPHVANIAVVTARTRRQANQNKQERRSGERRTVAGDGAVADHDGHLEAALADDLGEERVAQLLRLGFLCARATEVVEGAGGGGER